VYLVKHASYTSVQTLSNVPPEAPTIDAGTTHLIVMRYTFNPALTNDDELALWVDPSSNQLGLGRDLSPLRPPPRPMALLTDKKLLSGAPACT
jgi:hypothetical protein